MSTQPTQNDVSKSHTISIKGHKKRNRFRPSVAEYAFTYSIEDEIGSDLIVMDQVSTGPITEIYKVWSKSQMCTMACKILSPDAANDPSHVRSIDQEYRILKRLDHPNIVRVYPPGEDVDNPHILMEYLVGPSLFTLLTKASRRRLKPDQALRIAIRVGAALGHLHEKGYIYRDLKPSNVIMRDNRPVLIDFGTAYKWRPGRAPRQRVGTDPYMAPEQCLKRALSPQVDVYGLGAVTYEMLTGEWPHEEQLMNVFDRSKIHTRFPQVAYLPGSIRDKVLGIVDGLETVVMKCLARRRKDRYQNIAEVVYELDAVLEREQSLLPDSVRKAGVEALTGHKAA